jgi:hypothetical protein
MRPCNSHPNVVILLLREGKGMPRILLNRLSIEYLAMLDFSHAQDSWREVGGPTGDVHFRVLRHSWPLDDERHIDILFKRELFLA